MNVLIYQDYTHNNGALHRALCRAFGTAHVAFCDAREIAEGVLDGGTHLFVMPGGADLYYAEKLNGAGNAAIRAWVEDGGCYLGICAGAYYGCAAIDWAKGESEHAIARPRELAFFAGTAVGPVYEFIQDGDFNSSWHAAAAIEGGDGACDGKVLYAGGPVFVPAAANDPNVQVLARYTGLPGRPAAIVECSVGAGRAILCSPHPEYDAHSLEGRLYRHANPFYGHERQVADILGAENTEIRHIWSWLMERCAPARRKAA